MKTYLKVTIGVVIAVIVTLIVVGFTTRGGSQRYGDNSTLSGGLTLQLSNSGDTFTAGTAAPVTISKSGTFTQNTYGHIVSAGSCNTGSSTLFAIANPFAASSTVTIQLVSAIGNATTSTFYVGTSTASTGLLASNVSPSLINASIPTTTAFQISSGITVGDPGYISAGATSFRTIEIGPSNYVVGYATSTATGAGAINYSPGFTSCTYKAVWTN